MSRFSSFRRLSRRSLEAVKQPRSYRHRFRPRLESLEDRTVPVTINPGDYLVTDISGGIIRVDPASGSQTVISSGGSFLSTRGVAIGSNGDLLVVDGNGVGGGAKAVFRVSSTTGAQSTISSGGSFDSLVEIAIAGENTYVVDRNAFGGSGGVIRLDIVNGAQTAVSSGGLFASPNDIAVATNGDLLVATERPLAAPAALFGLTH